MCTAATYTGKDHYFGRNLDLELSYNESVTVTPRKFPLKFHQVHDMNEHFAIIGMATVVADYPLYYDATNEKGLSMAGLNFPGNADYKEPAEDVDNVASFEFIPWILGQCETVADVRKLLAKINITNVEFSEQFPPSPLHWMISDKNESITVEQTKAGINVYDNPVGIMTNNPEFPFQMFTLNNYRRVSPKPVASTFADGLELDEYTRGMGSMGLPGDLSSNSRFVKATFTKLNAPKMADENTSVSQFFHILGSVEQQKGCCDVGNGKFEFTIYSSCCNVDRGIYYYKTYDNSQITAVDMHKEDLDSAALKSYKLIEEQQIFAQN